MTNEFFQIICWLKLTISDKALKNKEVKSGFCVDGKDIFYFLMDDAIPPIVFALCFFSPLVLFHPALVVVIPGLSKALLYSNYLLVMPQLVHFTSSLHCWMIPLTPSLPILVDFLMKNLRLISTHLPLKLFFHSFFIDHQTFTLSMGQNLAFHLLLSFCVLCVLQTESLNKQSSTSLIKNLYSDFSFLIFSTRLFFNPKSFYFFDFSSSFWEIYPHLF